MSKPHACPYCPAMFKWGNDADSHLGVRAGNDRCGENAYWKLRGHVDEKHPDEGFRCPRRLEVPFLPEDKSKDWWHQRGSHRSCSYCGSMHPDDLFAAIEAKGTVTGTDKNYKIYCDVPATETAPAASHVKFYFQHLDAAGQDRFIELYNSKAMVLEPRFGLYRAPYFAAPAGEPKMR